MNAVVQDAATSAASAAPAVAKFVPKIVRVVTVPLLKLKPGMTIYVLVRAAMHKAQPLKTEQNPKDGEKAKEPPMLLDVVNLESGELQQVIPGAILVDILNDNYPTASYVGKGFQIAVSEQKASAGGGGRRYNTYNVSEIEVPQELRAKLPAPPAAPTPTEKAPAAASARK